MIEGLRLHHIGLAVRELRPSAALYTNRLGYRDASGPIHDPGQTAWVQFLQLGDEPAYLELVAPDGDASKLTKAVARGGGLNHLCYSSGPLAAAIAALEATGMLLISDPRPGVAFAGRRICWLKGEDPLLIELVERRDDHDRCEPGTGPAV